MRRLLETPLQHETIRAEVQLLVDGGDIQAIRGFAADDQAKFLEIVDQVRACNCGPSPHERC